MADLKGEIFKDKKGEFRGRTKSNNGNIIATTEGYKNKQSAKKALDLLGIKKNKIEDQTKEKPKKG